ncbi:MAG: selenium-dependent molybdenum cofactor biosynthesis protein YqeB [Halanaerobiales bacterium]
MTVNRKVLVKGGGDLASGVIYRLYKAGLEVTVAEKSRPSMVRRTVSFGQAVYDGEYEVEDIPARLITNHDQFNNCLSAGIIPVFVSELMRAVRDWFKPDIIVDARMMKRENDTDIDESSLVIGLGPGFEVGKDVHAVVETCRGHYLGRTLYEGRALPDTGQPGEVQGYTEERVVYAPRDGNFNSNKEIGDYINKGEQFGLVGKTPVKAKISGIIRGQIHPGYETDKGMKIGDIDPRAERDHCFKISDKALAVGGGVLEAIFHLKQKWQNN